MITGVVNAQMEATLQLTVKGPNRQIERVAAVIDTGYNGSLTLPSTIVSQLGLKLQRRGNAILADGSVTPFDIYSAVVVWDGHLRTIPVDEIDSTPLIGTALLADYELTSEFRQNGKVTIKKLRSRRRR
jgi:clan AA aspartic protease